MGTVRLLLDTHAFLWRMAGSVQMSDRANVLIDDSDNDVLVSAASAWEIATKHRLGKLPDGGAVVGGFSTAIRDLRATELPITVEHALIAGGFDIGHRDPFDRVLAAQALHEAAVLISRDPAFADFPVTVEW